MNADPMPKIPLDDAAGNRGLFRRMLRKQLIKCRMSLSGDQHGRLSVAVCDHLKVGFPELARLRVAFCWPMKNEPDLRPLMSLWLESGLSGFMALLPVVQEEGEPLAFRAWRPDCPMSKDRYGIPTPSEGAFIVPEALLIPLNAFDTNGYRLGYGGGYFDRTLVDLNPVPLSIGVGFELSRVDSICPEAHDVRLDAVVTEAGIFRYGT